MVKVTVKWRLIYHLLCEVSPCCQAIFTDKLSLCPPKPSTHPPLHIALFPRGSWGWKSRWEFRMLDSEFCTRIGTGRAGPSSQPLTSLFSSCSQLPAAPGEGGDMPRTLLCHCTSKLHPHLLQTVILLPLLSLRLCTKPEPLTLGNLSLGEWFTQPAKSGNSRTCLLWKRGSPP